MLLAPRDPSRACPFNSLYWDFFDRHREQLDGHPRISMMYRAFDRVSADKRAALLEQAAHDKADLDAL